MHPKYLGMLHMMQAQPGHTIAKLNGLTQNLEVLMSPARDKYGKPRKDELGQPLFNVFESRVAACEYRNEIARQAFGEMTSEHRRQIERFEAIADKICGQASRTEDVVKVLAKAFKNAYPNAPTVNVRDIADLFHWSQANARKILAAKRFKKHVMPKKMEANSHKQYTLDVIPEIYDWQSEKAAAEAARKAAKQAGKKKGPSKH